MTKDIVSSSDLREAYYASRPDWKIKPIEDKPGQLGLTCPHCDGKTVVAKKKFLQGAGLARQIKAQFAMQNDVRHCPYCMEAAQIPDRYRKG